MQLQLLIILGEIKSYNTLLNVFYLVLFQLHDKISIEKLFLLL